MKKATLDLVVTAETRIAFHLSGVGVPAIGMPTGLPHQAAIELVALLEADENLDFDRRARHLRSYAEACIPVAFRTWFQAWSGDPNEDSVLCVHASDRHVSALPWAELLMPCTDPPRRGWVVRVCELDGVQPPAGPLATPVKLLFAAWANLASQPMAGIERESREFVANVARDPLITIERLTDPTRAAFFDACQTFAPGIIHLSPPSLISEGNELALPVTPEIQALPPSQQSPAAPVASPPQFDLLTLKEVADELKRNKVSCSLILLNACFAGGVGSNQLAESLEAVALGWPALVADDTAADFAFSFYQRLREGLTPVEAVQQFADTRWTPRAAVEFPVVWLPTPAWVEWKPMPPPVAPVPAPVPAPGAVPTTPSPAVVTIDFQPRPYVNPALLVNFIPALVHLNLKAPSAFIGQTADLCISCDTGSGTSTFRHAVKLSIPTNLVPPENVVFPVLHELVDRRARRRLITFTATVRDTGGRIMDVQTKSTTWMGATEWLNKPEAWKYVPAFVDPLDAGVVSIFEEATRTLRTLGSPQDEFVGYRNTANSVNVRTQLQAIYQTLRDGRERLTYINPPASPLFEGEKAVGQFVRSHSEVVSHRLGSCHDLTLLMAACAEYVGIRPLVILFNGHTFVGFWMTAPAHTNYWAPPKLSPDSWIIDTAKELLRLVIEEAVLVVETTVLGKPERSFDDACNDGFNYLQQREAFMQVAVDVYRARTYGIRPV